MAHLSHPGRAQGDFKIEARVAGGSVCRWRMLGFRISASGSEGFHCECRAAIVGGPFPSACCEIIWLPVSGFKTTAKRPYGCFVAFGADRGTGLCVSAPLRHTPSVPSPKSQPSRLPAPPRLRPLMSLWSGLVWFLYQAHRRHLYGPAFEQPRHPATSGLASPLLIHNLPSYFPFSGWSEVFSIQSCPLPGKRWDGDLASNNTVSPGFPLEKPHFGLPREMVQNTRFCFSPEVAAFQWLSKMCLICSAVAELFDGGEGSEKMKTFQCFHLERAFPFESVWHFIKKYKSKLFQRG